jgi:hypothetical protein
MVILERGTSKCQYRRKKMLLKIKARADIIIKHAGNTTKEKNKQAEVSTSTYKNQV